MTAACGFDSLSGLFQDSDCAAQCTALGCPAEFLNNGVCDSECASWECGWDQGDCGFCALNCTIQTGSRSSLGNGICEAACDFASCNWDGNDCGTCASGCFAPMINDSHCDSACLTPACDSDGLDCPLCAAACFPYMLQDGHCDAPCSTAACQWDGGDCDCSPGCTPALLSNAECDASCNVSACDYDNFVCGVCAPGCFPDMLGNAVCNSACNTAACEWDHLDCGCAPNCSLADYGACKSSCLVPSCAYDSMPGFPQCSSPVSAFSAQLYHLLTTSFRSTYSHSDLCLPASPGCTASVWQQSATTCVPDCARSLLCLGSFGNCDAACATGCVACVLGGRCVKCAASWLQFYTLCVKQCPAHYSPAARMPTVCVPDSDRSTPASPTIYYVASDSQTTGDGSFDAPFTSISQAFAAAYSQYTTIFLLQGTHALDTLVPSARLHSLSDAYLYESPQPLDISVQPASCSQVPAHPNCTDTPPVLVYDNLHPVTLTIAGNVTFKGLVFTALSTLVPDCTDVRCTYCPTVTRRGSTYIDDRGRPITAFAPASLCLPFHNASFITVLSQAAFLADTCSFLNFRQEFAALIAFADSNVTLTSVQFLNVSTTIAAVSRAAGFAMSCVLTISGCSFQYLGNGYEYNAAKLWGGVATVAGVGRVTVDGTNVTRNVVGSWLFDISDSAFVTIANSVFRSNVGGSIRVVSALVLPSEVLAQNLTHVSVSNCSFRNSSAQALLLAVSGSLTNALVRNCSFVFLSSPASAVLSTAVLRALTSAETAGGFLGITAQGKKTDLYVSPRTHQLIDVQFANCSAQKVLQVHNVPRVVVMNMSVKACGEAKELRNVNTDVLAGLIRQNESYITLLATNAPAPQCTGLVELVSIGETSVADSDFSYNVCAQGTVGLAASQIEGSFDMRRSLIAYNVGNYSKLGTVLDVSGSGSLELSEVSVLGNIHGALVGQGILALTLPTRISSCLFLSNTIPDGGTLNMHGSLSVLNSTFSRNSCSGSTAAGLVYAPSATGSQLTLTASVFSSNVAVVGAAVFLFDQAATRIPVQLLVTRSTFVNNTSQTAGSCVRIDASIGLSNDSRIDWTNFANSTSANGALAVSFTVGVLTVDFCVFSGNTAGSAGAIYGNHPRSLIPAKPCLLLLSNSLFTLNSGYSILMLNNPDRYTQGQSFNITLYKNTGRGVYLQYCYWQDVNSSYISNYVATSGPTFIVSFFCDLSITGSVFRANIAKLTGGAMTLSIISKIALTGVLFEANSAMRGGALYAEQGVTLAVSQCRFRNNTSTMEGAAIYFFTGPLTSANSTVTDTVFEENVSTQGFGSVSLITSLVICQRVQFVRNRAVSAAGFLLYLSTLTLVDSAFLSQTSAQGSFVTSTASTMNVTNCTFQAGSADAKGGAMYLSSSSIWLAGTAFRALRAKAGVAIAAFAASFVSIRNCEFTDLTAEQSYGGSVLLSETQFQDYGSRYSALSNGAVVGQSAVVSLAAGVMTSVASTSGAGLYCVDCIVALEAMTFRNLTGTEGACVHIVRSLSPCSLLVTNSQFTDSHTGAIRLDGVNATIESSLFANNTGEDGAALVLACALYSVCPARIAHTEFVSNAAFHSGGAIRWSLRKPQLLNVTFRGNSAVYGPDIASFPVSLYSHALSLRDIASGQVANAVISVQLVDHYGQIVSTEHSALADLLPQNPSVTTLAGNTRSQANNGLFSFSQFTVTAIPGSVVNATVTTSAIDPDLLVLADLEIPYTPALTLTVYMRDCVAGETLQAAACYVCPEGRYSLDPARPCADCPEGAHCYGNFTMVPLAGYWRSSPSTAVFWQCVNEAACVGSPGPALSFIGECAEGYYGNLCHGCISGFSRSGNDVCALCPSAVINALQLSGILLGTLLLCLIIIKMSLLSAHRMQSHSSIFLKILVNYVQLTAITAAFQMNWPSYTLRLLRAQDSVSKVSMQLFSVDCFMDDGSENTQSNTYYKKMTFIAGIPVGIITVSLAVWGTVACVLRSKSYLKCHMVNSVVVLFFIAHPSIITFMFDAFNCRVLNPGEYWLNSYLNIRCWDSQHSRYAMLVALPSLLLWGVCVPLLALIALVSMRKRLAETQMRIRLGFLYNGYEGQKYYWEFVIMYRKMIVITLAVFLTTVSTYIQVLCVLLVLVVAYILHVRSNPYSLFALNQLEKRSIIVTATTMYCGLFYMTKELTGAVEAALFALIVLVNAYFLLYWVVNVCGVLWRFCILRFPWIRRAFTKLYYVTPMPPAQLSPQDPAAEDQEASFSMDRSSMFHSRIGSHSEKSFDVPENSLERPLGTPTVHAISDQKRLHE